MTCICYNAMTCEVESKLLALELISMMNRVCVQRSLQKDIKEKNSVPCIFIFPSMYYSLGVQWLFSVGLFSPSPCFPCDHLWLDLLSLHFMSMIASLLFVKPKYILYPKRFYPASPRDLPYSPHNGSTQLFLLYGIEWFLIVGVWLSHQGDYFLRKKAVDCIQQPQESVGNFTYMFNEWDFR